jgi:hypothetical protein
VEVVGGEPVEALADQHSTDEVGWKESPNAADGDKGVGAHSEATGSQT